MWLKGDLSMWTKSTRMGNHNQGVRTSILIGHFLAKGFWPSHISVCPACSELTTDSTSCWERPLQTPPTPILLTSCSVSMGLHVSQFVQDTVSLTGNASSPGPLTSIWGLEAVCPRTQAGGDRKWEADFIELEWKPTNSHRCRRLG